MRGRVWTLTQTDDTLWYYVYTNQDNHGSTGSVWNMGLGPEPVEPDKSLKGVGHVKQEPEEDGLKLTSAHNSVEEELLTDYFQLNVQLGNLYKDWGHRDDHFRQIASIFTGEFSHRPYVCAYLLTCVVNNVWVLNGRAVGFAGTALILFLYCVFTGVRMLKQDPVECLFSFICSSNNHISRIQGMVERLCFTLGPRLVTIQDTHYHDFPTLQALAGKTVHDLNTPSHIRTLG